MITFELNGDNFSTPKNWEEIKFGKFLKYLSEVAPLMPKALTEIYEGENMLKAWQQLTKKDKAKCFDFFALVVGFWCNLPKDTITESMDIEQLEAAYWAIELDLSIYDFKPSEDFTGFLIGNTEYLLPKQHMIGSTVIEFTEAANFELNFEGVENGNWVAMLDVMAVICRPKGEVYNYTEANHIARKNTFKNVTMDNILNVSFFLLKLNSILKDNLLIYSLQRYKDKQNERQPLVKNTVGI